MHANLRRVDGFSSILEALSQRGFSFRDFIDGGAGAGHTAAAMLKHGFDTSVCYAFEPFPGNHRFFDGLDPRIQLVRGALGNYDGTGALLVPSVVESSSAWGERGMSGYSSVGYLAKRGFIKRTLLRMLGRFPREEPVRVMRGDDAVPESANVDFIKLDLQGGELDALQGMERLVADATVLWVEYSGDAPVLEFLLGRGFSLFDTPYLFNGSPNDLAPEFEVSREISLSTGEAAFSAIRVTSWSDYESEFARLQRDNQLVQTDIAAVKADRLADVMEAFPPSA
jgi:FkbM family methyltransferase